MLQVFKTQQGWMVDFELSDQRSEIVDLFGTTVLPTPFTAQVNVSNVVRELSRLNPSETVVVK